MTTEAKIDKIFEAVTELKIEVARQIAYQRNQAEMLKQHAAQITILEAARNQTIGKQVLKQGLFALVCSSIGAAITAAAKHF